MLAATESIVATASGAAGLSDPIYALVADRPTLAELQRRYVEFILNEVGGHRRHAAEKLGLNNRTIYRLLERYNLSSVDDENEVATLDDNDSGAEG